MDKTISMMDNLGNNIVKPNTIQEHIHQPENKEIHDKNKVERQNQCQLKVDIKRLDQQYFYMIEI